MQRMIWLFAFTLISIGVWAQPKIQLIQFATGFDRPIGIEDCGDSRLFIVEQDGLIWILDSLGNKLPEPFLDIDARVLSTGNEQGLLGLAFHPKYAQNGFFYVHYSQNNGGDTRVSRFSVMPDNPNKGNPDSEFIILEQDQPFSNHNGGALEFSPIDSMLYLGLGDGGSGGDPQNNGQKKSTFLGKVLRIDVNPDNPVPYVVPPDNPFVGNTEYKPEIWSLGTRNVWRLSFDRLTGDMWMGDVGQNAREEIDFEPAGVGGRNYGWRCYEGNQTYNTNGCLGIANYTPPVFEYANPSLGCSVTGGYVYRGSVYTDLYGVYLHTDYCSGRWWATSKTPAGTFSTTQIANLTDYEYTSLGEDYKGELYVAGLSTGRIYKIKELCSPFQVSGTATDSVCTGSLTGQITLSSTGNTGNVSYNWSNGSTSQNQSSLDPGSYIVVATDGNGCIRRDTFVIAANNPPAPVLSVTSGDVNLCPGETVVLQSTTAPQGYTYQWTNNGMAIQNALEQSFTANAAGAYAVQFVSAACSISAPLAINVVLTELTAPGINLEQGDNFLCPGESAIIGLSGVPTDYTIQWFTSGGPVTGANDAQLTVTEGGLYFAEISGACGMVNSDNFIINQEFSQSPTISQIGNDLIVSGIYSSYQWSLNGTPLPGATTNSIQVNDPGTYACQLVSDGGCVYLVSVQTVGAQLPASVKECTLSPNPTKGIAVLQLELNKSEHVTIALVDASGRQIFMQTHDNNQLKLDIDMRMLQPGIYVLRIETSTGIISRRLVKE